MATSKPADVKKGISLLWETLQCPICLELMTAPVSTKCDHQFCKFCMMKLLDNSKQNRADCPVCKAKITRRSLQESPGFQSLVAGLQDMIRAYEHDTRTNYFSGLSWPFKDSHGTQEETPHDGSSGDTRDADLDMEKHADLDNLSHSSTIAAQNGFAKLMGFQDSAPSMTENEGLDSGLGDAPPASDKKISSPENEAEAAQLDASCGSEEATLAHKGGFVKCLSLSPIPDESEHNSSRRKHKKKSKILQQRKKKSLEKVAEWLMKVPTDGTLKFDEPEGNGDDSDSCSSASTIDIKQHMNDMASKRDNHAKPLEEQVFGAVYKRRSSKSAPAPPNSFADPSLSAESQTYESASVISNENCPSQHEMGEASNDTSRDFFKEARQIEIREINDARVEELDKPGSKENKDKEDSVSVAKTRKRTRSALQQIDSDLKDQTCAESEAPNQKKPDERKGRVTKSDKSKTGRVPKPLVLVAVQEGERIPKLAARAEDVQLQIESYPSSEDKEVSQLRSTRRSRRLQVFTEEVQGARKKASLRARASRQNGSAAKPSEDLTSHMPGDTTQLENANKMSSTKGNGCVSHQDITEIENLSKPAVANEGSVGAEPPSEGSPARSVSLIPESTSQNSADVVKLTLLSHKPADRSPGDLQPETSVCENDEEPNDCEADTEQLMKSFKATKRKSFRFGGADAKKSCYAAIDKETDEDHQDSSRESARPSEVNQEALGNTGKSTCDLIPPSVSVLPIQMKKTVSETSDQVTVEALVHDGSRSGPGSVSADCRTSLDSALPPNQESKSRAESPLLSLVPQVVDSGLRFAAVEHEGGNQTSKRSLNSSSQQPPADTNEHVCTESSLTPDGLIPPDAQNDHEASGDISAHSSILSNKRKKRRAQTLESSSGSDTSGSKEDLPSLAQIFGTTTRPESACRDPGEGDPSDRLSACPSPDCVSPSQGSVDLFGTPEECDAPVTTNIEVSMESSQFSSEVLVTQQKMEMQKELARLEKLMALVSEVLQEKEGSPPKEGARRSDKAPDPEPQRFPQEAGQGCDRKNVPDAQGDVRPGPSDVAQVAEATPSRPDGVAEIVQHTGSSSKATAVSKTLTATKAQKNSSDGQENKENNSPPRDERKAKLVLVSSGLDPGEQAMVKKFAKTVGARVVSRVTPEVTHVVIGTDEQLVCERTLKYFLGIAGRKWVVSIHWISECFKQKKLLDEIPFEVRGDVVNGPNHQGPSRARSAQDGNLLMKGYTICFQGSFADMTTDEMELMVEQCGADVVDDPHVFEGKQDSHQLVIVQNRFESSSSRSYLSKHATVVTRAWLLDSVSTYSLQNLSSYSA
ncbi:unnamed protein product [Ophioblennius macclurei]